MQNKVWEQISQFLNRLRCENITRNTSVEIPGYTQEMAALEVLWKEYEILIHQFSEEQQQSPFKWFGSVPTKFIFNRSSHTIVQYNILLRLQKPISFNLFQKPGNIVQQANLVI